MQNYRECAECEIADNLFASESTGAQKVRCRNVAPVCNLFISTWLARSQSTFSPGVEQRPIQLLWFASICS